MRAERLIKIIKHLDLKFPGVEFGFPVGGDNISLYMATGVAEIEDSEGNNGYICLLEGIKDEFITIPNYTKVPRPMTEEGKLD